MTLTGFNVVQAIHYMRLAPTHLHSGRVNAPTRLGFLAQTDRLRADLAEGEAPNKPSATINR